MAKAIGIDLGTTNSCVAVMEGNKAKVIENAEGARTTPSMVAFTDSGEVLVGQTAKRQSITNPENTVFAIKRLIGRRYDDPITQKDKGMVPYKIVPGPNGDAWVEVKGKKYSPSQISAFILTKMKETAEAYLGQKVDPGGHHRSGLFQRRPAAGDQGRRPHCRPRSASHHQRADGGGARLRSGQEGQRQDRRLRSRRRHVRHFHSGGRRRRVRGQVDQRRHLPRRRGFRQAHHGLSGGRVQARRHGIDLRKDRLALQRLKDAAEKAKIELSSATQTEVNLPFITADQNGPKHLNIKLTRAKLEALVDDLDPEDGRPVQGRFEGCRPASRPRSTRSSWSAARPACRRCRKPCRSCSGGSRTRASTRTRWSRSAPPSRPACCRATSRTSCCSTSRRCRSGSRRSAAS